MKTLIRTTQHLLAHSPFRSRHTRVAICSCLCLVGAGAVLAMQPNPKHVQATAATLEEPKSTEKGKEKEASEESSDKETLNNKETGTAEETATAYYSGTPAIFSVNGGGASGRRALLVFSSNPEPKVRSQLQEDLAVMHHLLDKNVESGLSKEVRTRKAMGVDLFFSPDSAHMQTAYFEGYGAFFLLRVDSALLPTNKDQQASEDSQPRNSAWEEAKQEVLGQPMSGGMGGSAAPSEPFNEEKVNRLKSSVLEALKNAANIRALKADEGVTVCVIGSPKQGPGASSLVRRQMGRVDSTVYTKNVAGSGQRSTILTMRAKKGDIDAFANGKMNLEEFRRHAAISVYEGEPQTGMAFGTFGGGSGGFGGSYNYFK